jgi:glutathione S-transferase
VVVPSREDRYRRQAGFAREEEKVLELYQFEECEYSTQVRLKMSEWGIDYILRNVAKDKSKRPRLQSVSGQHDVPTLIDSWRNVIISGDEKKIIEYLQTHYQAHAKP